MHETAQSLNVCFSTTSSLFSGLIRWFTRASVSHALITFRSETLGKVMVMEATGRGFGLTPWSKWRQKNSLLARYRLLVPEAGQVASLQVLAESLGTEYDKLGLAGFVWRRLTRRARNPFHDAGKLFCSEAVARFLDGAGVPGFSRPQDWTPGELLAHAQTHDAVFAPVQDPKARLSAAHPNEVSS